MAEGRGKGSGGGSRQQKGPKKAGHAFFSVYFDLCFRCFFCKKEVYLVQGRGVRRRRLDQKEGEGVVGTIKRLLKQLALKNLTPFIYQLNCRW